jgi:NitT/TauT family transport system permease protein
MSRTIARLVAPVVGVVGFLASWQVLVHLFGVHKYLLPQPSDVIRHIASDPGFYVRHARTTLWEAALGFLLAFVVALAVATVMAHSRFIDRALQPLAVLIQVTPIIAYAPAIVVWRGFGLEPILIVTSLVCFVPFLLNGVSGLRSVDPNLLELAQSVHATRREIFFRLRLPSALPFLFSAARIAVGLALIGAVLGEFFAGVTGGLGYAVKVAQAHVLPLQLWGSIFVLGFLGSVSTLAIGTVERVVLRWHGSQRH